MTSLLARILTRSFPGKSPAPDENRPDPQAAPPDSSGRAEYESRAFALWRELLAGFERPRVLELGELDASTLASLAAQGVRMSVVGLDQARLPDLATELSTFPVSEPCQGALLWDLPNYLEADALRELGDWLSHHLEPGAVVLACLATQSPYPDRPGRYRVVDEATLRHETAPGGTRERRLSNADLGRCWPQLETLRSFLLRNGMQEYVLRRRVPRG